MTDPKEEYEKRLERAYESATLDYLRRTGNEQIPECDIQVFLSPDVVEEGTVDTESIDFRDVRAEVTVKGYLRADE